MGKGGGSQPTQNTTTTSNIPEYARPYFENLLERGQAESYRQYQPYGGERLAGFTPGQLATQRETMGMQTPGQFGVGTGMAGAGGIGSLGFGQQAAGSGQQFFGMATDPNTQQALMSPYQQSVTDIAKRGAIREAQIAQQQASLGAARQGTYGGARQELARGERERGLLDRLSGLQAEGSQKAFEDARRTLQFGSEFGLKGLQTGLQGSGQAIQAGQTLGQLGQTQQQADIQRLTAQDAVGAQQRAMEQQMLDQRYADFLRQRDYPMEQLGYYSNLLRGIPIGLSSTQTTSAPPPSIASQIGGLGLAGLGIAGAARTAGFAEGGSITAPPSPEELHRMGSRMPDKELAMLQEKLRTAPPGNETLMAAGEIQTRKNIREKANVPQVNTTPVIADLLTDGAMPQMPQQTPPEMQQQMQQQIAMLPENAGGVAALPAPNMDNMEPYTAAAGGMVAFDDGGSVARFDVGGGVSLTDVLRTLNMDERRSYQQTGRLPPRAQAMLTGQAALPAAPTPGMGTAGTGPATVTTAADPNAPAQRPLPENMRFYPGTAGLVQSQQPETQQPGTLPSGIEAILAQAERGEGPNVHSPAGISTAIPLPGQENRGKKDGAVDLGKKDLSPAALSETALMDKAKAQAQEMMGGLPAVSAFDDIKAEMRKASDERKSELKNTAYMRLAEFGLGMAAGTSPYFAANVGKAGIEALKGYADDLRQKKKLDADDRKILTDIKRMERADERDNVIKTAEIGTRIFSEMSANQRSQLSLEVQERVSSQSLEQQKLISGDTRDDRLITAASEQAQKIVQNDKRSLGRSAAENDAEVEKLFATLLSRARAARDNKGVAAPPPRAAGKLVGNTYVLPTGR
jgi:hypothetical protein